MQDVDFQCGDGPSGVCLLPVVSSAQAVEVGGVCAAVGVGDGVVDVAVDGGLLAAGEAAVPVAGADVADDLGAGPVAVHRWWRGRGLEDVEDPAGRVAGGGWA